MHQDPIAIIGKILEQNPKSYTRIHDLVDLGTNMVSAGLTHNKPTTTTPLTPDQEASSRLTATRRITAMCIDAALTEDDFETAYSYVTNRLSIPPPKNYSTPSDEYSWKAALQTGKYRRSSRTIPPTHLGTASANPEVRHLGQRIDCLSTALRIAPRATLTEIVNAYRRAEEELVAALAAEEELEDAWDERADVGLGRGAGGMPGTFGTPSPAAVRKQSTSRGMSVGGAGEKGEDKPMSLFDLSRASVASAQRNLTALSSLQRSGLGRLAGGFGVGVGGGGGGGAGDVSGGGAGSDDEDHAKRTRKRDQLREAAMGTLVSGVGWLVGAPASAPGTTGER